MNIIKGGLLILTAVLILDTTTLRAQTFSVVHTFTGGADGSGPIGGLALSSNTLYGTASLGGTNGDGTVFSVNTNGVGFTVLHTFAAPIAGNIPDLTNLDGAYPNSRLVLSSATLYGTTHWGGTNGSGTVFSLSSNGAGFTMLHTFTLLQGADNFGFQGTNSDGGNPSADFVVSGNTLYGTAFFGGTNGLGTVFSVSTNGSGFTVLHTFAAAGSDLHPTNSDGANPGYLVLSGSTLYGVTSGGGTNANGTVFAVATNGTGFSVLHTFTAQSGSNFTNSDGASPFDLILSGSTLYGSTYEGGVNGNGTVFSLGTDGTGFMVLHSFTPVNGYGTNSDGVGASQFLAGLKDV